MIGRQSGEFREAIDDVRPLATGLGELFAEDLVFEPQKRMDVAQIPADFRVDGAEYFTNALAQSEQERHVSVEPLPAGHYGLPYDAPQAVTEYRNK